MHPNACHTHPQDWIAQIFSSRAVQRGGVVRRAKLDVDREIGRAALELEVRKRGFHLVECGSQYVIFCTGDPLNIIC